MDICWLNERCLCSRGVFSAPIRGKQTRKRTVGASIVDADNQAHYTKPVSDEQGWARESKIGCLRLTFRKSKKQEKIRQTPRLFIFMENVPIRFCQNESERAANPSLLPTS